MISPTLPILYVSIYAVVGALAAPVSPLSVLSNDTLKRSIIPRFFPTTNDDERHVPIVPIHIIAPAAGLLCMYCSSLSSVP